MPTEFHKFQSIIFPFYGKYKIPDKITYYTEPTLETVDAYVCATFGKKEYLIDCAFSSIKFYSEKLKHLRSIYDEVIEFDATALNMSQLIRSKIKWGLDSKGDIYNLSHKQFFNFKCVRVRKIKENLVWVNGISYPFEFKYNIAESLDKKHLFAYLVKISNTWYLYNLSYEYKNKKKIML